MKKSLILIMQLVFYLWVTSCMGAQAYVSKIIDGDSLSVRLKNGTRGEFRLYGVDSPEYDQGYAAYAKSYLEKTVLYKKINYQAITRDRYGRNIVIVTKGALCINEELVKRGYAWVYTRYCKKDVCRKWKLLERRAQKTGIGLWQGRSPIPPWQWRHGRS